MYSFEIVYDKAPHYTAGRALTLKALAGSVAADFKDRGLLTQLPADPVNINQLKRLILSEKSVLSFLYEKI